MRNAIGIVRVSQVAGREGESFASPGMQRDKIEAACEREGLNLLDVIEELDVSGGTPLDLREGLRTAIEAVEAGKVGVIVGAYFDRLFRSLAVQGEVIARVEAAGGRLLAVDVGAVTNATAAQWLSGTQHGMMSEYFRRVSAERSAGAVRRAVERGVPPWPNVTPGYVRGDDRRFYPDPAKSPIVARAFQMRAAGSTVKDVRAFLREHDIDVTYHGATTLLCSRVVLGEIHFGKLVNLEAHAPIVDRHLWQAVQRVKVSRGRRAKSDRLLARLGVLRCGSCGARMVVGTANHGAYNLYRCPPNGDCTRRVTIGAEIAEAVVSDAVRGALANVEGRASAEQGIREAEQSVARAQTDLDAAVRAFGGFEDESSTRERLLELRAVVEDARAHRDQLGGDRSVVTLNAAEDWDRLSLDGRRALIRATVARAVVAPGRGADRIAVELVGE